MSPKHQLWALNISYEAPGAITILVMRVNNKHHNIVLIVLIILILTWTLILNNPDSDPTLPMIHPWSCKKSCTFTLNTTHDPVKGLIP